MYKTKALKAKHQTPKLPFILTAVGWLYVDRYNVEGAWLGVVLTIWAIFWIVAIINLFCCELVEPVWKEEK